MERVDTCPKCGCQFVLNGFDPDEPLNGSEVMCPTCKTVLEYKKNHICIKV